MYRRPVTGLVLSPFHPRWLSTFYAAISYVYLAPLPPTIVQRLLFASERLFHFSSLALDRERIVRPGFREFISHTWRLIRGQKTRREEKRERGGWNFNINICKGSCCCSRYVDAWPNNCGWNGTKIFGTFKRDCWNVCLSCIGERMKIQMLSIVCLKILLLMRLFKFNRYFFFLF